MNVAAYPANAALEGLYQQLLREAGERVLAEQSANVWVRGTEDVSFAVYDWDPVPGQVPVSSVYLLNVNWWSDDTTLPVAHLLWKDSEVPLAVPRGVIHVVTVSGDWAIWTQDFDADVAELKPDGRGVDVRVQGQGQTTLRVLYRPALRGGVLFKLRAESRRGPLALTALNVPGLWETKITLSGPERLRFFAS